MDRQMDIYPFNEPRKHWQPILAFNERFGPDHIEARFMNEQRTWQARLNNIRMLPTKQKTEPKPKIEVKSDPLSFLFEDSSNDETDQKAKTTSIQPNVQSCPKVSTAEQSTDSTVSVIETIELNLFEDDAPPLEHSIQEKVQDGWLENKMIELGFTGIDVSIPNMKKETDIAASSNKLRWQKSYRIPSRMQQAEGKSLQMAQAFVDRLKGSNIPSQFPSLKEINKRIEATNTKKRLHKDKKRLQKVRLNKGVLRTCERALFGAIKVQPSGLQVTF